PPQFDTADFAADSLGQFGDKLDLARVFVGRSDALAMFLQVFLQFYGRLVPLSQYHERFDDLTSYRIRLADHGGFDHSGMFDQSAFDFERANAIRGALDDVIGSADEPVVTIPIPGCPVACQIPVAAEPAFVLLGIVPILLEQPERPGRVDSHGNLAFLVC